MRKFFLNLVLIVLPATFLIIGLSFHRTWFSGDPEYAYLLNGINIATLHPVGHTDNPGTPAQIYSAVVLRIAHCVNFSDKNDLQTDVLSNPDAYVELERKVSVILNAMMMLFLGLFSLIILRNVWYSLVLQSTMFLSSNLLEIAFTKVSPEPVLIFTVMLLVSIVIKYYTDYEKDKKLYPWIFGLLTGFGLATKATFLPLAVLPFILLKGKKFKRNYLAAIIPSFILFTAPAIPEYPHMAKWFLGLSTHTGTYGQGASGIIDFGTYFSSLHAIATNNPALLLSLIIAVIVPAVFFLTGKIRSWSASLPMKFMTSLAAVQLLGILMVAKHYHANHYLIPLISLSGAIWVFAILLIKEQSGNSRVAMNKFLAPAVLVLFIIMGFSNRKYLQEANHGYIITNEEYTQVRNRLDTEFAGYVKAYYYPITINPYSALRWGSVYSRQLHLDALRSIYPEGLFYDFRINSFQVWETPLPVTDLVTDYGGKILLVGGPMTAEERKSVEKGGLSITQIYLGRAQAIYQVDTAKSLLFNELKQKPLWSITCNADTLSSDGKWFKAGNFRFANNNNQSGEAARSGQYSVKLPYRDSYAMAIELDSIKPGQKYRFTAWRKGGERKAFLVATSPKSEEFYIQNSEYLKVDDKGWKKVSLDITIPENYSSQTFKVYIWNSGDSQVFFDDFTLNRYH